MKYLYILTIAILGLTACGKEKEFQLNYPSLYKSVYFENTSKVRLFTLNGELTDAGLINRFTERYGEDYLFGNTTAVQFTQSDSVRILSSTSARIEEGNRFEDYFLSIKGNDLKFVPKDTARIIVRDEYTFNLHLAMGKYKPFYQKKEAIPYTSGYIYAYDILIGRFATATANQLNFPVVNYVLTQGTGFSPSVRKNSFNNHFDPTAYKQLEAGDTLAVQEFKMKYEK